MLLVIKQHFISRHIINVEGDKPVLIIRGENTHVDTLIKLMFSLPKNTNIFHCSCYSDLIPINLLGGREYRLVGDTCRMFCKIKIIGRTADYFFWDGIVNDYDNLDDDRFKTAQQYACLATGKLIHRMVLIEKCKNNLKGEMAQNLG